MTARAATNNPRTGPVLQLERTFDAPRERLFRAFTDPEWLARWWGPEGCRADDPRIDLRIGGAYRLDMRNSDGELIELSGVYREIDPPRRLVFTWEWGGDNPDGETLVTLELSERGGITELVLTHEGFSSEERRDLHRTGWTSSFECLDKAVPADE